MLVLVRTRSKLDAEELRRCGCDVRYVGRGYVVLDVDVCDWKRELEVALGEALERLKRGDVSMCEFTERRVAVRISVPRIDVDAAIRKYLWHLASRMRKECGKRAVFRREFVVLG